MMKVVKQSCKL